MIDIIEFTHALKSSWIRRLFKQKKKPKTKKKKSQQQLVQFIRS